MHTVKQFSNLKAFALACNKLSSDQIYDLFEHSIEKYLRNEILNLADQSSPEPVRSALITIGKFYEVPSLINY
jgi:hypothetical protein